MFKTFSLAYIVLVVFVGCEKKESKDRQHYPYPFSPLNGVVNSEELPYRSELCLNGRWSFMPVYSNELDDLIFPTEFLWDSTQIKIPSPWNVNSFAKGEPGDFVTFPSYPESWERANTAWMKRTFVVPENWNKKIMKLRFEAIAGRSKIYVNGKLAEENPEIFSPTEIDVTALIQREENEILVGVTKGDVTSIGSEIAGIWQDVHLIAYPELMIGDVSIKSDVKNNQLIIVAKIHNYSTEPQSVTSAAVVRLWRKDHTEDINELPLPGGALGAEVLNFTSHETRSIDPGRMEEITLKQQIDGQLDYWTPEHPNLYGLTVELSSEENSSIDKKFARFSWRQFTVDGSQLFLNGEKIILKGDSWHFMGIPQMTRRYAYAWFQMLKNANANAVRLDVQPYPSFYRDVADEMGICVVDESELWSAKDDRNLAHYGLKPLEFGLVDTTRIPDLDDGIFFPEFRDGVPGIQPERLAPYSSTLNPGYDKRLPLYKPSPLFDSVKAVYGHTQDLSTTSSRGIH